MVSHLYILHCPKISFIHEQLRWVYHFIAQPTVIHEQHNEVIRLVYILVLFNLSSNHSAITLSFRSKFKSLSVSGQTGARRRLELTMRCEFHSMLMASLWLWDEEQQSKSCSFAWNLLVHMRCMRILCHEYLHHIPPFSWNFIRLMQLQIY